MNSYSTGLPKEVLGEALPWDVTVEGGIGHHAHQGASAVKEVSRPYWPRKDAVRVDMADVVSIGHDVRVQLRDLLAKVVVGVVRAGKDPVGSQAQPVETLPARRWHDQHHVSKAGAKPLDGAQAPCQPAEVLIVTTDEDVADHGDL